MGAEESKLDVLGETLLRRSIENTQGRLYWPSQPFEGHVQLQFACLHCGDAYISIEPYPQRWGELVGLNCECFQCKMKRKVRSDFVQAGELRGLIWSFDGRRAADLAGHLHKFFLYGPPDSSSSLPEELSYRRMVYPRNIGEPQGVDRDVTAAGHPSHLAPPSGPLSTSAPGAHGDNAATSANSRSPSPLRSASALGRAKEGGELREGSAAGRALREIVFAARSPASNWSAKSWAARSRGCSLPRDFLWPEDAFAKPMEERVDLFRNAVRRYVRTKESIKLKVSRQSLLDDASMALLRASPAQLRGTISVQFKGEETVDIGGVARELLTLLARDLLDPRRGLVRAEGLHESLHPSPASEVNHEHLQFFVLLGRVLGRALITGQCLHAPLSQALFRAMTGRALTFPDFASVDREAYLQMQRILDFSEEELDACELFFSVDCDVVGVVTTKELVPGGADIKVTTSNRREWVALYSQWKMVDSVELQILSILEGFFDLVPVQLLSLFNSMELEQMVCGMEVVDVANWRRFTVCIHLDRTPLMDWFWAMVDAMDESGRAKVLQFVTGSSRVPVSFEYLHPPFTVVLVHSLSPTSLPMAHTCFHRLDMPPFASYADMTRAFHAALEFGAEGFGT